ncbi:hypothetical protein [Pantoea piersonii]|jgi:hypothetical protein|uniref:hypothetical protein n=1 Tax=Pantoea piersonii TaxID=2364647 RepID=UPI000EA377A5|nr:hypothetical protein [Pantoea piersonii]MBZ6385115.1 hypothetical protein [Pantoea piersonii]MBZ6385191.1 hypothetical protein [Pantoea piersonii]MBZ6398643.1 hypothetical protein [Pantoea piersonii]MBZ6398719.1 hypothetical protein [Pantoea piersonii]MBZ6406573.1 hypothetical protein [Pantoea piersonii]
MNKLTADKCREQFEEWLTSLPGFELADVEKRDDGKYSYSETEWCWKSWKASRAALEIALPVLEQREKGESDWIEWRGNYQPVNPSVIVKVRWADGDMDTGPCRHFFLGKNCGNPVVAYRVIEQQERERGEEE